MPNLRIQHGGAYTSDISSICNEARRNGNNPNLAFIATSCVEGGVELLVNLAYSANRAPGLLPVDLSLYVVGFRNENDTFIFDDNNYVRIFNEQFPDDNYRRLVGIDGSYRSLGYADGFDDLTISRINLESSVANISGFAGGIFTDENKKSMARLIIASSEAVRSRQVCAQVENVLVGNAQYQPQFHWNIIHNWGGLGLAH